MPFQPDSFLFKFFDESATATENEMAFGDRMREAHGGWPPAVNDQNPIVRKNYFATIASVYKNLLSICADAIVNAPKDANTLKRAFCEGVAPLARAMLPPSPAPSRVSPEVYKVATVVLAAAGLQPKKNPMTSDEHFKAFCRSLVSTDVTELGRWLHIHYA